MSNDHRPRRFLLILAALLLPAATCGLTPSLEELLRRIEVMESRMSRIERISSNSRLPLVLMDEHDIVVGTVLEYNDMMIYASAASNGAWPVVVRNERARTTILYQPTGTPPVVLEADAHRFYTPAREYGRSIYFDSRDCSGTPYSGDPYGWSPWPEPWLRPGENVLYVRPLEPSIGTRRVFHSRYIAKGCIRNAVWNANSAATAAPTRLHSNPSQISPPTPRPSASSTSAS